MQSDLAKSNYFPALTGIRTVASCMVFFHHFNPFKAVWFGNFFHDFIGEFHVGVTIFFVLSGFLICYRYYDDVKEGKAGIKPYLINRFARIYPMYFIITIISFLPFVCNCTFSENTHVLFLNLTFLRGFFDEYKFTGIPGGWSLTVEELFYFLFPLLILISGRIKLIFQPLIFIGTGILLWLLFRNASFHGFFSSQQFLFEFTFFGRCIEFYAGIQLALLFMRRNNVSELQNKFYKTLSGATYIIVCIGLLVINRWFSQEKNTFLFFETLINNIILPVGIAVFFYGLLTEKSIIRTMLATKLFTLLGKSSYIFYLIHNGFLFSFFYFALHLNIIVIFILLQCTSILLYFIAEKPLNNLIRRLA
ncbi:MAG: acyltransferase [Bacteroidetes bacterium]|nr:acyltransferase [Bacteroidota bacterium]